jgi:transposase
MLGFCAVRKKVSDECNAPGTQAPAPSPSDLAAENARLRRENERLRMERDILKKAALIFGSASR